MSAKVVKLSVAGQMVQIIVSSAHLDMFLNGLLKKVFKTAIVSDYCFEAGGSGDEVVSADIKSCWYKRQTKYKYTIVCKATIEGRERTLLYHKMLHPSKASAVRDQVPSSDKLNLTYWTE